MTIENLRLKILYTAFFYLSLPSEFYLMHQISVFIYNSTFSTKIMLKMTHKLILKLLVSHFLIFALNK